MRRIRQSASALVLLCCTAAAGASEVLFGAYVGLPFDGAAPVFGLAAVPGFQRTPGQPLFPPGGGRAAGLHLRIGDGQGLEMSLNGVPLRRTWMLYQDAGPSSSTGQQAVDWHLVAGVVLGAGLIYAIADADDVRVSGCSGPNCPPARPPERPEPEPDPEAPEDGGEP